MNNIFNAMNVQIREITAVLDEINGYIMVNIGKNTMVVAKLKKVNKTNIVGELSDGVTITIKNSKVVQCLQN